MSRMNWRIVHSDVAQMACGVIVRSPVMVDALMWSLVGLLQFGFIVLKVEYDVVKSFGLMNFSGLHYGAKE